MTEGPELQSVSTQNDTRPFINIYRLTYEEELAAMLRAYIGAYYKHTRKLNIKNPDDLHLLEKIISEEHIKEVPGLYPSEQGPIGLTADKKTLFAYSVKAGYHDQLGKVIADVFQKKIAALIAQNIELPADTFKLAICINQLNIHWTTLMVTFSGINKNAYENLRHAFHNTPSERNGEPPLSEQVQDVINFLHSQDARRFQDPNELGIPVKQITLTYFDSLKSNAPPELNSNPADKELPSEIKTLQEGLKAFIDYQKKHNTLVNLQEGRNLKQYRMTCGDFSVLHACLSWFYNDIPADFYAEEYRTLSYKLRTLVQRPSINNAQAILYKDTELYLETEPPLAQVPFSEVSTPLDPNYINHAHVFFLQLFFALTCATFSYFSLPMVWPTLFPILNTLTASLVLASTFYLTASPLPELCTFLSGKSRDAITPTWHLWSLQFLYSALLSYGAYFLMLNFFPATSVILLSWLTGATFAGTFCITGDPFRAVVHFCFEEEEPSLPVMSSSNTLTNLPLSPSLTLLHNKVYTPCVHLFETMQAAPPSASPTVSTPLRSQSPRPVP